MNRYLPTLVLAARHIGSRWNLWRIHAVRTTLLLFCLLSGLAWGQSYPQRPIRLIVPYPASGANDMIARMLSAPLGARLGQSVIVDNRGGASTVIGAEIAAHAPADGYTLFVATVTTLVVVPLTRNHLPYDTERDFTPVTMLAEQPYTLGVCPSLPVKSMSQFIAYAKANPGKLAYGAANLWGSGHLAGEMLKQLAGIDILHVPYKGGMQIVTDTIAGRLAFMFATISTMEPFGRSGQLRIIAVSSAKRSMAMPDVPTIAESGVPGYETASWNSVVVQHGVPPSVINRLNKEIGTIIKSSDVRDRLLKQGIEVQPGTPLDFERFLKEERARVSKLIKATGIAPE